MKVLKWIAIIIVTLVALFVIVGYLLPSTISVERSIVVNTETERVHRLVGELRAWDEWTPFKELDPTVEVTFGASTSGVGASQSWTDKSGGGTLTFTEWDPETGIAFDISFAGSDPMTSYISYEAAEGGTKVTWDMNGELGGGVAGGYLALVISPSVGSMYDMGLQKLKAKAEALDPLPEEPVEGETAEAEEATE